MKVLIVSTYDAVGGAARAAVRLHDALNASEIECTMRVLVKGGESHTVVAKRTLRELFGMRIVNRYIGKNLKKMQQSQNSNLRSLSLWGAGLVEEINTSDADIVNLHWVCHEMLSIKDIARITKPLVWTLHDMWAFCGAEHVSSDEPNARWRLGYTKANRSSSDSGWDLDRWTWMRKQHHWKRPFRLVTPSSWLQNCVKESALMGNWPVQRIGNPIDISIFQPWPKDVARKMFGLPCDKPIILAGAWGYGSNDNKGGDLLRAALRQLVNTRPDVNTVILGAESSRGDEDWVDSVHFIRHLSDDQSLALLYSAADVFVISSRIENMPQMALEAQACGTPVVGFDTSGVRDAVIHGQTGLLVPCYEPSRMADAIAEILDAPDLQQRLGSEARKHVSELCAPGKVAKDYIDLFTEILQSPHDA